MNNQINYFCGSKINLFLDITGLYKNGYHALRSIFVETDICDEIIVTPNENNTLEYTIQNISLPQENLLKKAGDLMIGIAGKVVKGYTFKVIKNIPVGGGMGGGSSNAAFIMNFLNKSWELRLSSNQLIKLGNKIGADIPFFIKGGIARVYGTGNIIKKINIKNFELPLLIVKPSISINTVEAYRKIDQNSLYRSNYHTEISFKKLFSAINRKNIRSISENIYNKFESVAFQEHSELLQIKTAIEQSGALKAFMSGSGSTMVGLYDSNEELKTGYNNLINTGYDVYITGVISRNHEKRRNY